MKKILFIILFSLFFVPTLVVFAQGESVSIGNPLDAEFATGESENLAESEGGVVGFAQSRLGILLDTMLGILVAVSLIPIVFGGIQLITSQGNSEKVEKGKKALFWGVMGLVLGFLAIVIMNTLLKILLPGS